MKLVLAIAQHKLEAAVKVEGDGKVEALTSDSHSSSVHAALAAGQVKPQLP